VVDDTASEEVAVNPGGATVGARHLLMRTVVTYIHTPTGKRLTTAHGTLAVVDLWLSIGHRAKGELPGGYDKTIEELEHAKTFLL
jgi:hypothetical protein